MKCKYCDNEAKWIYVSDTDPSLCDKCVCRPCSCNSFPNEDWEPEFDDPADWDYLCKLL